MERYLAKPLLRVNAFLGEGPAWDDREKALWWIDIKGSAFHRYVPGPLDGTETADPDAAKRDTVWDLPLMPGTIAPAENGHVLLALQDGIYSMNPSAGISSLKLLQPVEADCPANRFNDGKCDPAGRFWAGTLGLNETDPVGTLYCLDNGRLTPRVSGLTISNGMCWSPDHRTYYLTDTPTRRVDAFDYDETSGKISNRRTAFTIPEGQGNPDGMTIDTEGMLWVAQWGGGRVCRYNPATGEQLAVIEVGAERSSACAFGGPELDTLYITSAGGRGWGHEAEAGTVFAVRLPYHGLPAYRYAGPVC